MPKLKNSNTTFWVGKNWSKMPKWSWSLRQTVSPERSIFDRTKIGEKCQNSKNSNAAFWWFFKHCDLFIFSVVCLHLSEIIFFDNFKTFVTVCSPSHGSQILQWILDFNCTFNAWLLLLSSALKRVEKTSFQSFEWCNRGLSRGLRFFSDSSFFLQKRFS